MKRLIYHLQSGLHRRLLVAGLWVLVFPPCAGQDSLSVPTAADSLSLPVPREMSEEVSCYFTYPQGSSTIHPRLGSNAAELKKLDAFITQALAHPTLFISRIRLTGYCSVEGGAARNEALSSERVEGFYRYLHEHYPRLSRYPCDRAWVGEDWDGLFERVRVSSIFEREEVLTIIRAVREYDTRELLLRELNGGQPWLFMQRKFFPQLRRVELRIEYGEAEAQQTAHEPHQTASPRPSPKERGMEIDTAWFSPLTVKNLTWSTNHIENDSTWSFPLSFGEGRGEAVGSCGPLFSFKSNLLLAAGIFPDLSHTAPVANAALEYFIDERWSVEAGALYSNWHYNSRREFQGLTGLRLEARRRVAFPGDRFGAYLGLYGRVGDYDSRTLDKGQAISGGDALNPAGAQGAANTYGIPQSTLNYTGNYWDAGLSGGLTLRLVGNLGLEIGVRGGYVATNADRYIRDGVLNRFESRRKYRKVKPTALSLSLVYYLY